MSWWLRSRGCLVALGVIGVLLLAGVVAVRRAVDPESLRQLTERQLSEALGRPVTVGAVDLSFLPRPIATGRQVALGGGGAGQAPSLALREVRIVPNVRSLFGDAIVVERVELIGLDASVRRNAEGEWQLPFNLGAAAPGDTEAGGRTVRVAEIALREGSFRLVDDVLRTPAGSPEVVAITGIAATLADDGRRRTLTGMTGTIGASSIAGGGRIGADGFGLDLAWKRLVTADLPMVFALAGTTPPEGLRVEGDQPLTLDLRVTPAGMVSATGRLAAATVALDALTLNGLASPLAFDGRSLALDPLTFAAYGGRHRGAFTADVSRSPATWRVRSSIDGVDVNALLTATTSARDRLEGRGQLALDLRGQAGLPLERVGGTIRLTLVDGVIRGLGLLAAINRALAITGGTGADTTFERLSATLAVANGTFTTNDLQLHAGELDVFATGTIGFDQRLALTGRAVLTREKTEQLRQQSPHVSSQRNERGELELPFSIRGTAAAPAIAIDTGAMLRRAGEKELKRGIRRGLDRLFRP